MKKILDRLLLGYILQLPLMLVVLAMLFAIRFFDSFYTTILIQWITVKTIPGLGFLTATLIALATSSLVHHERGWALIKNHLQHYAVSQFFITIIEQWRIFRGLAQTHGAILAPYYRENSTYYPAVITGLIPLGGDSYLISVVFGDLPFPKPFLLKESEIIYAKLSFREAVAYTLSWGFAAETFKAKLETQTLGDYIRKSKELIRP